MKTTHYPDYDVMDFIDEWDSHTKEIVRKRLQAVSSPEFLTDKELRYIADISRHIVYDNREKIIDWIVYHIEQTLQDETGESQRKTGIPPKKILIRQGLEDLDHAARLNYGKEFGELDDEQQFKLLSDFQKKGEFFKTLAGDIVEAYYSHPTIWSEIGYGGPMYPRIYVRIEKGLTDPWEATRNGE